MSNMFDEDEVKSYIERIQALEGEIATSKGTHMNFAKKKREEIKEVFDDAKENGVPKKVLAKLLKRLELEADIDAIDKELDDDHKPLFQSLAEVFAAYRHPTQTSMFDGDDDGFDPDFVEPSEGKGEPDEQEEGEKVLNGED